MDIPGFNYRSNLYQKAYKALPQQVVLGSETASTVSSRGVYKFPVERKAGAKYDDHQSSSYDVEHCSWSDLPEDNFILSEDLPYDMGEFVWTGFDYLASRRRIMTIGPAILRCSVSSTWLTCQGSLLPLPQPIGTRPAETLHIRSATGTGRGR